MCFFCFLLSHSYYSNEVDNYGSPYGYSQSVTTQQTMGYDISADFVDSTTAYEPRNNTIIDPDFIGMHSKYSEFVLGIDFSRRRISFSFIPYIQKCCWRTYVFWLFLAYYLSMCILFDENTWINVNVYVFWSLVLTLASEKKRCSTPLLHVYVLSLLNFTKFPVSRFVCFSFNHISKNRFLFGKKKQKRFRCSQ